MSFSAKERSIKHIWTIVTKLDARKPMSTAAQIVQYKNQNTYCILNSKQKYSGKDSSEVVSYYCNTLVKQEKLVILTAPQLKSHSGLACHFSIITTVTFWRVKELHHAQPWLAFLHREGGNKKRPMPVKERWNSRTPMQLLSVPMKFLLHLDECLVLQISWQ